MNALVVGDPLTGLLHCTQNKLIKVKTISPLTFFKILFRY